MQTFKPGLWNTDEKRQFELNTFQCVIQNSLNVKGKGGGAISFTVSEYEARCPQVINNLPRMQVNVIAAAFASDFSHVSVLCAQIIVGYIPLCLHLFLSLLLPVVLHRVPLLYMVCKSGTLVSRIMSRSELRNCHNLQNWVQIWIHFTEHNSARRAAFPSSCWRTFRNSIAMWGVRLDKPLHWFELSFCC